MILNGKMINPGELRTPINLGRRVALADQGGFTPVTYQAYSGVWARWTNAHGPEGLQAQLQQGQELATILIRYRSDIDATCAVQKNGAWFEIVSIDDIQERHEYMELQVRRVRAG